MIKLNDAETRVLAALPETGMGYQLVEGTQFDHRIRRGIAYNGELFFDENESRTVLRTLSYPQVLREATKSYGTFQSLRVLSRAEAPITLSERKMHAVVKAAPARGAAIEKTKTGEVFERYSAYKDDLRVRADGSWTPGTYATTAEDAKNVKTGKDAVSRYALPNPESACYEFTGRPEKDTAIQKGVVEPAFDQKGWGRRGDLSRRDTAQNGDGAGRDSKRIRGAYQARPALDQPTPGSPGVWHGYQRVDISFVNGREFRDAMVFNAQELEVPEDLARIEIREICLRHPEKPGGISDC